VAVAKSMEGSRSKVAGSRIMWEMQRLDFHALVLSIYAMVINCSILIICVSVLYSWLSTENGKEEVLKITILFFVNVVLVDVSIWVSSSVLEIAILSLVQLLYLWLLQFVLQGHPFHWLEDDQQDDIPVFRSIIGFHCVSFQQIVEIQTKLCFCVDTLYHLIIHVIN
jgi:hypothetical protein